MSSFSYQQKRDWARKKMEDAVERGCIEEAQKFLEISGAYDHAMEQRLQKRPGY